jgi:2-dehydro-3-deoxyphosphooctonate aldolase (KDO 8-P synthase)
MKLAGFDVGLEHPIFLIAGTCVIESRQMAMDTAGTLKEITAALGIPFIYKSSFDKANRSSAAPASTRASRSWLTCAAKSACRS